MLGQWPKGCHCPGSVVGKSEDLALPPTGFGLVLTLEFPRSCLAMEPASQHRRHTLGPDEWPDDLVQWALVGKFQQISGLLGRGRGGESD